MNNLETLNRQIMKKVSHSMKDRIDRIIKSMTITDKASKKLSALQSALLGHAYSESVAQRCLDLVEHYNMVEAAFLDCVDKPSPTIHLTTTDPYTGLWQADRIAFTAHRVVYGFTSCLSTVFAVYFIAFNGPIDDLRLNALPCTDREKQFVDSSERLINYILFFRNLIDPNGVSVKYEPVYLHSIEDPTDSAYWLYRNVAENPMMANYTLQLEAQRDSYGLPHAPTLSDGFRP